MTNHEGYVSIQSFKSSPRRPHDAAPPSGVTARDADDDALDLAAVGLDDAGVHRGVGRLEADFSAGLLVEALEGRFLAVEQRDDLLAVAGRLAAFDDDVVAVAQVVVDHALPADAQDVDAVL